MFLVDAGDGLDNNESWGRSSTQQALLISGNIDIRYYALRGNVERVVDAIEAGGAFDV